jgi:hypothetical protein
MYALVLYDNKNYISSSRIGYYTGKSYTHQGSIYPVTSDLLIDDLHIKYKSYELADKKGKKCIEKYEIVFDYKIIEL